MIKIENEDDITLTHIKGNWRYKIFRYKKETYILDGSTYWISFLLPILSWFLPINAYEGSDKVIKGLKEETSVKSINPSWNIILIVMFLSGIFAKVVQKIANKFYLGDNFNTVFIYMVPIIFIGYFTISRYLKGRKMLNMLNHQYSKRRIRFKLPLEKNREGWKKIVSALLVLIIFYLGAGLYSIKNLVVESVHVRDYIIYFLVIFAWFILVMNSTMHSENLVGATIIIEDKFRE